MNHTAEKSLQWRPPLEVLTGQTVDISILLCFLFWDVVYVTRYDDTQYKGQVGSNKSSEIRGRFVGFSHHVGHALTFKILGRHSAYHPSISRKTRQGWENNLKLEAEVETSRPEFSSSQNATPKETTSFYRRLTSPPTHSTFDHLTTSPQGQRRWGA
jgi:hypothetical protein